MECTFYVMSTDGFNAYKERALQERTGFDPLRARQALPAELVQKIVKARIYENTERYR